VAAGRGQLVARGTDLNKKSKVQGYKAHNFSACSRTLSFFKKSESKVQLLSA
jgi:hypothetical protein